MLGKHLGPLYLFKNIRNMTKEQIAIYLANNSRTTLISEERNRQVETEGYNWAHDDSHKNGELAMAAGAYAIAEDARGEYRDQLFIPGWWPWSMESWKPATYGNIEERIKELSKAGALIAAEIDRLQRVKIKSIYGNGSIDNSEE